MAREMAVQMLYQVDLGASDALAAIAAFDLVEYLRQSRAASEAEDEAAPPAASRASAEEDLAKARAAFEQAGAMVLATRERLEEIDERIRRQTENWRLERMPAVDRNILRLAAWEMLHERDVPRLVVLDEAVELAKRFGSENSSRFVNGLLDGLMRAAEEEEARR
jgi:transcription antitermination factor NusB